jgi:hypothetical protein
MTLSTPIDIAQLLGGAPKRQCEQPLGEAQTPAQRPAIIKNPATTANSCRRELQTGMHPKYLAAGNFTWVPLQTRATIESTKRQPNLSLSCDQQTGRPS